MHRLGRRHALAGRYLLADRIGVGGMGVVWRARDLRTGQWVAAKVLGRHDAALLLRFVHEQSVRIVHPHVLTPTGWAAEDDVVVLTTDLVRGGSVADLLADHGPLPEPLVRVLLDQTLRGLAAVHAAGIVHLDVKPANLLLEPTGRSRPHLRVADFGVASPPDTVGSRWTGPVGTDGYMAPEQRRGEPPHPRQDVYAAGVVAVELLTGRRPDLRQGAPNGPLRPLLDAMTEPDPARRTPSVGAALHHLRRLGVPDTAPGVDVPDRLGDPPARWRRRWPLVG